MIEKRGPHTWRVGFQVSNGSDRMWIRTTVRFPSDMTEAKQRKEAEIALAHLRADYDRGLVDPRQLNHTVRTFSELWMQQYVLPNLRPTTARNYRHLLDSRILPMIGDVPLAKLTPITLATWLNDVKTAPRRSTRLPDEQLKSHRTPANVARLAAPESHAKPLSASTVRHYYVAMDCMLSKAVQWGVLAVNPMSRVDPPRVRPQRVHYLTEERAVELLRHLAQEENMCLRAAVLLALLCGLRLGEVGALRLSDVDWDARTIDITRALNYAPGRGNYEDAPKSFAGERLITLPPAMMDVLAATRDYQQDMAALIGDAWKGQGWIVHAWNGAQLHHDTPSKWFRRFADRHGFPEIRFHDLRHTHATVLLANNIDAVAVATRLGHANASTTLKIYAHALRRRDYDAANVAQALMDHARDDT